jgi:hypothetical protein
MEHLEVEAALGEHGQGDEREGKRYFPMFAGHECLLSLGMGVMVEGAYAGIRVGTSSQPSLAVVSKSAVRRSRGGLFRNVVERRGTS